MDHFYTFFVMFKRSQMSSQTTLLVENVLFTCPHPPSEFITCQHICAEQNISRKCIFRGFLCCQPIRRGWVGTPPFQICVKAFKIALVFFLCVAWSHSSWLMFQHSPLCSGLVLHLCISSFLIKIPTSKRPRGWVMGERWSRGCSLFSLF